MQRRWWKLLGIASGVSVVVGVAATGAAVARSERRRRAYTPSEIRSRLHARYEEATTRSQQAATDADGTTTAEDATDA